MWTNEVFPMMVWLVLAFLGGMFGAAIGGLLSFVFCGVGAILASTLMLAGYPGSAGLVDAWVTWGPFVGPQTAFVGGCWAAGYAKYHAGFHNGRDICKPLASLNRPDVLLVGGIGGAVGALCTWLAWQLPKMTTACAEKMIDSTNNVALGVTLALIIGRLVVGKTGVFGKVPANVNRYEGDANNCWIPWQHSSTNILIYATMIGLTTAVLTYVNSDMHLMIFGIMTVLFSFMILGQGVIAGHHYAITAYFAVVMTGNVAWGLAFALLAGFACDFFAFLFTAHGDTHIDPPTCGIALCGIIQPILLCVGLMPYAPMSGKNTTVAKDLFNPGEMFMPDGSISGLVALAIALIALPLITKWLRTSKLFVGKA